MARESRRVLLVGETATSSLWLVNWLSKHGCRCCFATSFLEACKWIRRIRFDLVLSQYQLPDRTAFPLLELLAGLPTSLLLSTPVENGSLWLPMLDLGRRCVGAPVLRSREILPALGKLLDIEVPSNKTGVCESSGHAQSSRASMVCEEVRSK